MEAKKSNQISVSPILFVLGAVILLGLGFLGGQVFQTGKNGSSATQVQQQTTQQGFPGGSSNMGRGTMRGGFGEVTAVSDSSITIKNSFSGESVTYAITSSTKITDNNETAGIADIKTGDTVMVQTVSTDSKEATEIRLNVQMPTGGPGMRSGQTDANVQTN